MCVGHGSHLGFIQLVMEGTPTKSVINAEQHQVIDILKSVANLFAQNIPTTQCEFLDNTTLISTSLAEDDPARVVPIGYYGDNKQLVYIGASDVFETAAQMFESKPPLPESSPEYMYLFALALESCGFDSNTDNSQIDALYCTCMSIAELSLYTPIGSIYRRLRSVECRWHDVHPGSRFLQCLVAVKEIGVIEDFGQSDQLQSDLCDFFGWPKPMEFRKIAESIQDDLFATHRFVLLARRDKPGLLLEENMRYVDEVKSIVT